jgi:hypothetical protein
MQIQVVHDHAIHAQALHVNGFHADAAHDNALSARVMQAQGTYVTPEVKKDRQTNNANMK